MHSENITTPFGRRPMTLALLKGQLKAAEPREEDSVDKWKVFRDICEARELLGVSDRTLAVLNALISFYPGPQLVRSKSLVVFPSNEQLTLRAHGITGTTLRRHLAALIERGLILRKDSPNGKRYAHRDRSGRLEEAFGFSLAPLMTRSSEFSQIAEKVASDRRQLRLSRERLSVSRRDIRKLIAAGLEEGIPGDWPSFQHRLDHILTRLSRAPTADEIEVAGEQCSTLRAEIFNLLEKQVNPPITDANDVQNERHLQNPNTDTIIENETSPEKTDAAKATLNREWKQTEPNAISLPIVLKACPQIHDYSPTGHIATWNELVRAATVVRLMLGVSSPSYEAATTTMGPQAAAVAMACILERGSLINSAGGYLTDLTRRAQAGSFSLKPMLTALLRTKVGETASGRHVGC